MATNSDCKCNHEFVLVLSGISTLDERVANALLEAGCDDATISLRFGTIYLSFDREAASLEEAIVSAIRDVNNSNIGASVKYVDACNLLTQAEIARKINRSRQMVGQYISGKRGPGNFPGPVCSITEAHPLWMWCEVSYWFLENGIVEERVLHESRVIASVNSVLDLLHQRQHQPKLIDELLKMSGVPTLSASV